MGSNSLDSQHHVVIFPFMSKGHTIPLLQFARLLLRRRLAVTVFTTPANRPFVAGSLSDTPASVQDLPFPDDVPGIPAGAESTDRIPFSMSLFFHFAASTKRMQPDFERALASLPPVTFIVSDGFLWWTLDSASKLGIPRLCFYGMSNYAASLSRAAVEHRLVRGPGSENEPITPTDFPWIKLTKKDVDLPPLDPEASDVASEFHTNSITSTVNSFGLIVNSFYELEPAFVDYWNQKSSPKAFCVGPLCLAEPIPQAVEPRPAWIRWLDEKLEKGSTVLYVAFGSQADISKQQMKEIAIGLEESEVNFLWVVKNCQLADRGTENSGGGGFEERGKNRGMVVREWVNQKEVLRHKSVEGFLSHCGWNSVIESVCAGVPILGWPMMAEQPLNAKMVAEEIGVGLRVESCDDGGLVRAEALKDKVKELMEGEEGKAARKKVREVSEMAKKAVEENGSSCHTLDFLIRDICEHKHV